MDKKYIDWERGYKWKAHQQWIESLNRRTHRALLKALGAADAEQYTKPLMAEGRTVVTITPETWHTWDYNKVD